MGVSYQLVNRSKRERVSFLRISASTARELAGNPVSAAITTWYLLQNQGDAIAFISDEGSGVSSDHEPVDEWLTYPDVTNVLVQQLIEAKILKDEGIIHYFEGEPQVYDRILRNVWDKPEQ